MFFCKSVSCLFVFLGVRIIPKGVFIFVLVINYVIGIVRFIFIIGIFVIKTVIFVSFGIVVHRQKPPFKNISTCAVAIQWLVCMQAIAMQTGHWISNPLPNEQNAAANADARARKREFCECGSGLDARMSIQPHRWKYFSNFL